MNPFELPGPDFLVFYSALAFVLFASLVWLRRSWEPDPHESVQLTDPYSIAFLREGANEVLRLATTGLIDRELLGVEDSTLRITNRNRARLITNPLERAVLDHFGNKGQDIKTMFASTEPQQECKKIEALLQERGLLADQQAKMRSFLTGLAAIGVLWYTAYVKIHMAIERRHPFRYLLVLILVFTVVGIVLALPRKTLRGKRFLKDMQRLFKPLRERSKSFVSHANSNELLLMGAVFGMVALPTQTYPFVKTLFAKADGGQGSCGSSCGSSSGSSCSSSSCGSSCGGGGGCGGCGS